MSLSMPSFATTGAELMARWEGAVVRARGLIEAIARR